MLWKSISEVPPSATATAGGSAAAAQPAREPKASRSKPPARARQSSTRAKGMALATNGHEQSSIDVSRDDIARLAYILQEQCGGEGGSVTDVSRDDIARLAHSLWERRGGECGSPEQDWFRAESELKARRSSAA